MASCLYAPPRLKANTHGAAGRRIQGPRADLLVSGHYIRFGETEAIPVTNREQNVFRVNCVDKPVR